MVLLVLYAFEIVAYNGVAPSQVALHVLLLSCVVVHHCKLARSFVLRDLAYKAATILS